MGKKIDEREDKTVKQQLSQQRQKMTDRVEMDEVKVHQYWSQYCLRLQECRFYSDELQCAAVRDLEKRKVDLRREKTDSDTVAAHQIPTPNHNSYMKAINYIEQHNRRRKPKRKDAVKSRRLLNKNIDTDECDGGNSNIGWMNIESFECEMLHYMAVIV